jgi:hypothetical protein
MTILEEFRRDSGRVLDRLVDSELGTQERRELLASLDDEPGAWRNCALAFLEAQSWRLQLSRVASEPILEQMKTPARASGAASGLAWGSWLAVAASLLVAFAMGSRFPFDPRGLQTEEPLLTQRDDAPPATLGGPPEEAAPASDPPFTLTLTPLDGDNREAIELPVVEADGAGEFAASENRSALSRSLVQRFEQDGFEVDRHQQLWPFDLPDGRRVLVPIEEVDIRTPSVERL